MILMSKKILIVIVAALLLAVGAWYYVNSKKTAGTAPTQTTTATEQPSTLASLKDLVAKGVAQSCTYTTDKSQGTIYMNGGKVRADINATVGSVETKAHMIMIDNTSYIWTEGTSIGFKMAYDPNATPVSGASPSTLQQGFVDANTSMNYKCNVWVADGEKFALPTGITFRTISQ